MSIQKLSLLFFMFFAPFALYIKPYFEKNRSFFYSFSTVFLLSSIKKKEYFIKTKISSLFILKKGFFCVR